MSRQRWTAIAVNVLAIAVALVAPRVAVGLYIVVTTLLLVVPLLGLRRHRRRLREEWSTPRSRLVGARNLPPAAARRRADCAGQRMI